MRPKWFVTAAGMAIVAACGGSSSSPGPSGPQIAIADFSFTPSTLSVKAGTTVTWVNQGTMTHNTVSDSAVWSSGNLSPPGSGGGAYGGGATAGGSFHYTFNTPGTYGYHCSIHPPAMYPGFVGTITVTQ
jgi:plastocyanin